MGNIFSSPEVVICEKDIIDFILSKPEFFEDLIEDEINEDEKHDNKNNKRKRRRFQYFSNAQWWATSWGQMLKNDKIRDINTHEGKEFRRLFRVPAPFFLDWLVPECKAINIFGAARDIIPVETKLLICLRLLARGNVVDDC
jgi:hypothetical protein